ncbi:MAG: hypothetical protein AAF736_08185, partial [Pseudomonadota bacterium]
MIPRLAAAALPGLLCIASLALCVQQASLTLASRAFDRWTGNPGLQAPQQVQAPLAVALLLPDPAAYWLKGRWKMAQNPADDSALAAFDRVAQARPYDFHPSLGRASWWAANEPDSSEFAAALAEAMVLGPNESRVFAAIFPLARLHWHYLSPDQQQQLEALLVSTAVREPALAIELARDYGFAGPACRLTAENLLAVGHCQRLGIIDREEG